jgi:hypothetical protein
MGSPENSAYSVQGFTAKGESMLKSHTHTKDCPDRKEAATERAQHEAESKKREVVRQALAQAEWFDWYKK